MTDVTEVPQENYQTVYHVVNALTTGTLLSKTSRVSEFAQIILL